MRIVLLFVLFFLAKANAATLKVGQLQPFKTIKYAIAQAVNGDTILVSSGVYREKNLVIDKSIVFIGDQYPVLDGEKKYEVLSVKANHVVVDGFKVIKKRNFEY